MLLVTNVHDHICMVQHGVCCLTMNTDCNHYWRLGSLHNQQFLNHIEYASNVMQGDLSLLASNGHAGLPCGHIICYKAQAPLRMRFARQLQAQLELTVGKLEAVQGTNAEDAEGSVEESLDAGGDTDTPTANG